MKLRLLIVLAAASLLSACAGAPARVNDGTRKIANVDPVEVGKVGIGTKPVIGFSSEIKQSEALLVFVPKVNQSFLQFKYQSAKTKLFLSEKARTVLIEAVAQYRKDFDARSLNIRAKKTNAVYGSVKGQLEWGLMSYNGKSEPKISYGYVFVDRKKPYFIITAPSSPNLGEQTDGVESDDNSPTVALYFTKNQATELAEMLMQDNLEGLLGERGIRDYSENADDYGE
jgi:hypothetical protein